MSLGFALANSHQFTETNAVKEPTHGWWATVCDKTPLNKLKVQF